MKTYLMNCNRYAGLIRNCMAISDTFPHESTLNLVLELLRVPYNYELCLYEVPEKLMQKVAIANMCEMSLIQLRDSGEDIDYAMLGENSRPVLLSILYTML